MEFSSRFKGEDIPNVMQTRYRYNGKELDRMHGLNWLDYGARWYDPTIARWNAVDPLGEKSRRWSPYNYCVDNPVRFIDPDGKQGEDRSGNPASEPDFNFRTKKIVGTFTTAQSSTYVPLKREKPMPKLLSDKAQKQIAINNLTRQKQPDVLMSSMKYEAQKSMKGMSNFDKGMSSSPVVQGAAVGVLASLTIGVIPELATAIGTTANTAIVAGENLITSSTAVTVAAGAVEGVTKSLTDSPPDAPYLINNPTYQVFSDLIGSIITIIKDKKQQDK